MALYRYIKAPPKVPGQTTRVPRTVPFVLMVTGAFLLLWASWPILSFSIFTQSLFAQTVSPIAGSHDWETDVGKGSAVLAVINEQNEGVDLRNANTWFPTQPQKKVVTPVNSYTLSIAKLKITNASVIIAGDDLSKSLIHYGGTGLPGEYGNAIVFGHSVLPQFYNPKDYMTIFSTLPTLKTGDEISVTYDTVTYRYLVETMTVRDPSDLGGLEQRFDDSYMTLVTCVPPGTYWKRLYVTARLVQPNEEEI